MESGQNTLADQSSSKQQSLNNQKNRQKDTQNGDKDKKSGRYRKPRKKYHSKNQQQKQQNLLKISAAEQKNLRESLIQSLNDQSYSCSICCDSVKFKDQIWDCDKCFGIFHLKCIQQWANHSMFSKDSATGIQTSSQSQWRCPNCQHKRSALPDKYTCFCHRLTNPPIDRFITAHSCGTICSKPLVWSSVSESQSKYKCQHSCNLQCHPGPCPPCEAPAPKEFNQCYCGKNQLQLSCKDISDDSYQEKRSCQNICGKQLNCKRHKCQDICHPGNCNPCETEYKVGCYCTKSTKSVLCSRQMKLEQFSCEKQCEQQFSCGKHKCSMKCHPTSLNDHSVCPLDPSKVLKCPCGRSTLQSKRTDCSDTVSTCDSQCGKIQKLKCGHNSQCLLKCHFNQIQYQVLGSEQQSKQCQYSECQSEVIVSCRCGQSQQTFQCSRVNKDPNFEFLCEKLCGEKLSCKKHSCQNKCCSIKEHVCNIICGKEMSCGQHKCQQSCHKGNCGKCQALVVDYNENYSCSCGRTVVPGPIKCGTQLPQCPFTCTKERLCGHFESTPELWSSFVGRSGMRHPCHPNTEDCPSCLVKVEKQCLCGKQTMLAFCGRNATCANLCGKDLLNCHHKCIRGCHEGVCQQSNYCDQVCGLIRNCGHKCTSKCHVNSLKSCEEIGACPIQLKQTCPCGNFSQIVDCSQNQNINLQCNEDCLVIQKNSRLAKALGIDEEQQFRNKFSQELISLANENIPFVKQVENTAQDLIQKTFDKPIVRRFSSMKWKPTLVIKMMMNEIYPQIEYFEEDQNKNKTLALKTIPGNRQLPQRLLSQQIQLMVKKGLKIPNYVELMQRNKVLEVEQVQKKQCVLNHHHLTSKLLDIQRMFVKYILDIFNSEPEISQEENDGFISKTIGFDYNIPHVESLKLSNGLNEEQLIMLDSLVESLRNEFSSLSSCQCKCEDCLFISQPFLRFQNQTLSDIWTRIDLTPRELFVTSSHIATSQFYVLDDHLVWKSYEDFQGNIASGQPPQQSGTWKRKTPSEPLNPCILDFIYFSAMMILIDSQNIQNNHQNEKQIQLEQIPFDIIFNKMPPMNMKDSAHYISEMIKLQVEESQQKLQNRKQSANSINRYSSSSSQLSFNQTKFDALNAQND